MADNGQASAPSNHKVDASTESNTSHMPLLNEILELGLTQHGCERSDHGLSDAGNVSEVGSNHSSQEASLSELTSDEDQCNVIAEGEDIEQCLYDQEEEFPLLPHPANTNQQINVFSCTFTSTSYKASLLKSRVVPSTNQ